MTLFPTGDSTLVPVERKVVTFHVFGSPVQQAGTKTVPVGKTQQGRTMFRKITEGGKDLLPWRQAVSAGARVALAECGIFRGPCKLDVTFYFPMPKSRPAWMRSHPGAMVWKLTAPDTDKLIRAIGDSCTDGGLVSDDATFAMLVGRKLEVWEGWTGATVTITELDPRRQAADQPSVGGSFA